jgi:hypothetical protein
LSEPAALTRLTAMVALAAADANGNLLSNAEADLAGVPAKGKSNF